MGLKQRKTFFGLKRLGFALVFDVQASAHKKGPKYRQGIGIAG
jgi:hypothetical protein